MAGDGNRLKGSQLGYCGKGPPVAFQDMHAAAVAAACPPQSLPNTIVCKSL
jgi:hypothetical protein